MYINSQRGNWDKKVDDEVLKNQNGVYKFLLIS